MPTAAQTPRDIAVQRHLTALYRHSGKPAQLIQLSGVVTPVTAIMRVSEAEESVEGAAIEARIKGYSCQIQAHELAPLTGSFTGGRLELLAGHLFDGRANFDLDAEPLSFGRGGYQRLLQLSAAQDAGDGDWV